MDKNDFASIIAEHFKKTPTSQWSYHGYLEAMKSYFNTDAPIQTLKTLWRKRFVNYMKDVILSEDTDKEQRKAAYFLSKQVSSSHRVCELENLASQREGFAPRLSDRFRFLTQHVASSWMKNIALITINT
ncbi:34250_t:CDS:2, partial [Racocetra persica]